MAEETSPRPLHSQRIVVADDDPTIRSLLEVALREAGATVWLAADGRAALRLVEEANPDLILLDLSMPEMNGWKVLEQLAASPRTAKIPVVLQTSTEDLVSLDRARKNGVAAFISKPFRLNDVVETCRRVASGARPLAGKPPRDDAAQPVRVTSAGQNLALAGFLVDLDQGGAQVDLDSPLPPGRRVTLTIDKPEGPVRIEAEVRWITKAGERFHHGLSIVRP